MNFNISLDCLQKKAPNTCEIWWQYCILKRLFYIFVIFSKHNVECADHQCNFWRRRDVAVYNWWGFLKVFCIYLSFFTAIFCCGRKFLPNSWKLLFLVIFSIFIFVILLFETFFKIVASYLSLFKLINSLTVEVSGILITIAGEEKTSPKYPMKQQPCDYAVMRWSTLWVMNKVGSFKP